jgi:hypothetical protein
MVRDTAANWASNNPSLPVGVHGFETDTGLYKIGKGIAWNSVLYGDLDYGTNANGTYVKFPDGTLFQYGTKSFAQETVAVGSIYASLAFQIDLPVSFFSNEYSTKVNDSSSENLWYGSDSSSTTNFEARMFFYTTLGVGNRTADWSAIGRWKA